jgi:hypothetical protein
MSVGTDSTEHFLGPPMRKIAIRRRPQNYLNIWLSKILLFSKPSCRPRCWLNVGGAPISPIPPRPLAKSPELNRLASTDRPGAVLAALSRPPPRATVGHKAFPPKRVKRFYPVRASGRSTLGLYAERGTTFLEQIPWIAGPSSTSSSLCRRGCCQRDLSGRPRAHRRNAASCSGR